MSGCRIIGVVLVLLGTTLVRAEDKPRSVRVGMIGLDTSHVVAFAKILNDPRAPADFAGARIVAAFPGGNPNFPSSRTRVANYTKQLSEMQIEMVGSIDDLLKKVDVVLLESVDGTQHLEQVEPVFKAGKPVFIDKPLAGSLADALVIRELGRKYKTPWFSSSSLRYQPKFQAMLNNPEVGKIIGAETFGPSQLGVGHADLAFYGIHGIETLYTLMGTGCQSVTRVQTPYTELVVGTWKDGRVGTYRGIRDGTHRSGYGATVFGTRSIQQISSGADYRPLVKEIVQFFRTGKPPISPDETIELMAFIEAADASKRKGGAPVTLASVIEEARRPLSYQTQVDTVLKHDDGKWLWYHPRVAAVPGLGRNGQPRLYMTLQKHLGVSDHYSGLFVMRSEDRGATWTKPEAVPELDWRKESEQVDVAVADVTPGWHPHTGVVLAVGAQVRYSKGGKQLEDQPRSNQTAYAILDPKTGKWSSWKRLEMPADKKFDFARSACAQWVVRPDGTVLLPFYHGPSATRPHGVTVVECAFDGKELKYVRHGTELSLPVVRGLVEPSLVFFHGRYYLTIRNDERGYVTSSADGLTFAPIKPWTFDDGKDLGSYNTQQHWLAHGDGLFLVYTRRGANNDHVVRHRAPLFLARVDPEKLQVIRKSEQVLIPERGAELGNFGAVPINEEESWVTVAEGIWNEAARKRGAVGAVFVARVKWSKPNKLGAAR